MERTQIFAVVKEVLQYVLHGFVFCEKLQKKVVFSSSQHITR